MAEWIDRIVAVLTADQAALVGLLLLAGLSALVVVAGPAAWRRYCADPPPTSHRARMSWLEPAAWLATLAIDLWTVAAAALSVAWTAYVNAESWRVA